MNITVGITGDTQLKGHLSDILQRAGNMGPLFDAFGRDFLDDLSGAFIGSPDLVRSGVMKDSIAKGDAENVFDVSDNELVVGTKVWYSIFHKDRLQAGAPSDLPERWVTGITTYLETGRISVVGL